MPFRRPSPPFFWDHVLCLARRFGFGYSVFFPVVLFFSLNTPRLNFAKAYLRSRLGIKHSLPTCPRGCSLSFCKLAGWNRSRGPACRGVLAHPFSTGLALATSAFLRNKPYNAATLGMSVTNSGARTHKHTKLPAEEVGFGVVYVAFGLQEHTYRFIHK